MNMIDASPESECFRAKPTTLDAVLSRLYQRSLVILRLLTVFFLMLVVLGLLSGCVTAGRSTGSTAQAGNKCGPFTELSYDSRRDTPRTVQGVRVHNKAGANYGCWRKP